MTTYRRGIGDGLKAVWRDLFHNRRFNRGAAWGLMIIGALFAFEIFNFSTTQYALHDMLGDLTFAGLRWATILAIAFCGIDFAGIARLFTPEQGRDEPTEVYYLFGAWLLAAGFNATLTWWGVSVAISNNAGLQSGGAMSAEQLTTVVPVFVAAMVWLVRVLIIGTFSLAGDRLFTTAERGQYPTYRNGQGNRPRAYPPEQPLPSYKPQMLRPASQINRPVKAPPSPPPYRPAPKPQPASNQTSFIPPEPTYHPVSYGARSSENTERHYDA